MNKMAKYDLNKLEIKNAPEDAFLIHKIVLFHYFITNLKPVAAF